MIEAKFQDYLRKTSYIWISTVRADGMPQPTPLYFIWDEEKNYFVMLTRPTDQKIKNIKANSKVALNWASESGGEFVVIMGNAELDNKLTEAETKLYMAKYPHAVPDGMTVIRFIPERARGM